MAWCTLFPGLKPKEVPSTSASGGPRGVRLRGQLGRGLHPPAPHGRDPSAQGAPGRVFPGSLGISPRRTGWGRVPSGRGLLRERQRNLGEKLRPAVSLDLGQRLLVDPGGALVPLHRFPGALQDVWQRQLVLQSVEAPLWVALGGLVQLRLEFGRSVLGWFSRWDTHRTVLLTLRRPAAGPSLEPGSVVLALVAVLCPAPTPSRGPHG